MYCASCGTELSDPQQFCPKCGASLAVVPPPPKQRPVAVPAPPKLKRPSSNSRSPFLWLMAGVLIIVVAVSVTSNLHETSGEGSSSKKEVRSESAEGNPSIPRAAESPFNTGNVANDKLLALPEKEQALYLGAVANASCHGTRAFYMGSSHDHTAFWSVACRNGSSYSVEVDADELGSTKVLECSVLRAVTGTSCFVKLNN